MSPRREAAEFRAFRASDAEACLAVFDGNCPEFFAPNERAEYAAFLASVGEGYRVGVIAGRVAAAYGLLPGPAPGELRLCWILVSPEAQGVGVGGAIMSAVLAAAREAGAPVGIAASHKSAPFFARYGAIEVRRTEHGWGPDMHRIDMTLPIAG